MRMQMLTLMLMLTSWQVRWLSTTSYFGYAPINVAGFELGPRSFFSNITMSYDFRPRDDVAGLVDDVTGTAYPLVGTPLPIFKDYVQEGCTLERRVLILVTNCITLRDVCLISLTVPVCRRKHPKTAGARAQGTSTPR